MDLAQFEERLRDFDYPVSKGTLLAYLDEEQADAKLRQAVAQMPGDLFHDPQEVSEALGGLDDRGE